MQVSLSEKYLNMKLSTVVEFFIVSSDMHAWLDGSNEIIYFTNFYQMSKRRLLPWKGLIDYH